MTTDARIIKSAPYLFTFPNAAGGLSLAVGQRPIFGYHTQLISVLSLGAKR